MRIVLGLYGTFHLTDEAGNRIPLGTKLQALVAMLATERSGSRTRSWLQSRLWSRVEQEQASASLRQALTKLRGALGVEAGELLLATRDLVTLNMSRITLAGSPRDGVFLDGIDLHHEEGFEDWLRERRAEAERAAAQARQDADPVDGLADLQYFVLQPPIVYSDERNAEAQAVWICDQICARVRFERYVNIVDLRDLESDLTAKTYTNPPSAMLQIRLTRLGSNMQITAIARHPDDCRVLWTAMMTADQSKSHAISQDKLLEFGNQVVDSITEGCLGGPRRTDQGQPNLLSAIHQTFSMSSTGLVAARKQFTHLADTEARGSALAWLAFTGAIELSERKTCDRQIRLEEIEALIAAALDIDPLNPLVLALVAHVQSFLLRKHGSAAENLQMALRTGPHLAFVHDVCAMNAIYSGNLDSAHVHAQKAIRLGRFSPYKFFYDASACIAASINGDHRKAIISGQQALRKRPQFLAVKRHLFASQALLGFEDDAKQTLSDIRSAEPAFSAATIGEKDYPLPSPASVALLRGGFERLTGQKP